MRKPGTRQHRR